MSLQHLLITAITPGLAACLVGGPVRADVIEAVWIDGLNYAYEVVHMPDLDQRRLEFLGFGSAHCAPTASMNMIMYIANHGFPELEPGPGNWQAAANYDLATNAIGFLGVSMGTDSGGTDGAEWRDGVKGWIDLDKFTVTHQWATSVFSPRQELLTGVAISGGLVSYVYGAYTALGYTPDGWLVDRGGGHIVTLAKSERTPSIATLWARNPKCRSVSGVPVRARRGLSLHGPERRAGIPRQSQHVELRSGSAHRTRVRA